jgi:hypothetical protein
LLVTTAEHDVNVYKSARNIDKVDVAPVSGLNALNLLRPKRVLITKAALEAVRSASKKSADGAAQRAATRESAKAGAAKTARAPKAADAPKSAGAAHGKAGDK